MPQVPTNQMERKLRALYLQWLAGVPDHENDMSSYVDEFARKSKMLIVREGGQAASLGAYADFPVPKHLELSPVADKIYDQMQQGAIQASITAGLNSKDAARQLLNASIGKNYKQLERLARTETVSAYWKNQWDSTKDLPLIVMLWGSENSDRTCDYCLSRDGLVVEDSSIRDHPNGRCTLVPTLRSQVNYKGTLQPDGSVEMDPAWDKTTVKPEPIDPPYDKSIPNEEAKGGVESKALTIRKTPKVDKLPQQASVPANLREAVAKGAANPKNSSWQNVNGTYDKLLPGFVARDYQINCTRVATATEMRMRGFDVKAHPAPKGFDKSNKWIENNWYDPKTGRARSLKLAATERSLMQAMNKHPDGSRFLVVGPWENGGAHIWNAEKIDGQVQFIEGQVYNYGGQEVTRKYLDALTFDRYKGTKDAVRYLRVDDLLPADRIVEAFE